MVSLIELDDPYLPVSIHVEMDGPDFKDGIPLHLLTANLSDFQSIIDKTYLGLAKRKRLTKDDRARYFLLTKDIRHGSAETDIGIIFTSVQTAFPFFSTIGPTGLWEYAKQTFDFLKIIYKSMKKGEQPTYSWSGDNSQFQVNTGEQKNTYNGPVYNIGQMTVNNYQSMAKSIEEGAIEFVEFGDREKGKIRLDHSNADVFSLPSQIETTPIVLKCEIFDFNKFENLGKLFVFPGEIVAKGDYRFKVVGNQDVALFIEAMLRHQVTVTCLREISPNPFSLEKILRFQVLNVEH